MSQRNSSVQFCSRGTNFLKCRCFALNWLNCVKTIFMAKIFLSGKHENFFSRANFSFLLISIIMNLFEKVQHIWFGIWYESDSINLNLRSSLVDQIFSKDRHLLCKKFWNTFQAKKLLMKTKSLSPGENPVFVISSIVYGSMCFCVHIITCIFMFFICHSKLCCQRFQGPRFRWLITVWLEISSMLHIFIRTILFCDDQGIQKIVPYFGSLGSVEPVCFNNPFFLRSCKKYSDFADDEQNHL